MRQYSEGEASASIQKSHAVGRDSRFWWGDCGGREGAGEHMPHLMCQETHSTVRVVLDWPVTDTSIDGMSTVAWQVYWPASDVLTGPRVWVRDGPVLLATSLLLGATHWSVGTTVTKGTTYTVHSRACWPPAEPSKLFMICCF